MLVEYRTDLVLMDREAVATLTKRSTHTIRARCPVADRTPDGRPLYDVHACEAILAAIPTRKRRRDLTTESLSRNITV